MHIAWIHCRLFPGGALEVFKNLLQKELRKNPNEDFKIFTLIADTDFKEISLQIPWTEEIKKIEVIEALPKRLSSLFLYFTHHQIRFFSSLFNYRNLIVFYPFWMKILSRKIKRYQPEKIIISSFAIAKNITIPQCCKKTELYLHSPMQYIWSHHDEYLKKFTGRKKKIFQRITPHLRKRDKKYTKFDQITFNSKYTQELAKEIYNIEGEVQYPKIDDQFYLAGICRESLPYYVCLGRIVNFVRECKLIIEVFNELKLPLLMIGSGPDERYLKSIAWDTIIFMGRLNHEETIDILKQAKGLVNLTKESFWMGTVEALLLGVPVLGLNDGGTKELVDETSGILINKKEKKNLKEALIQFEKQHFDRKLISDTIREKI